MSRRFFQPRNPASVFSEANLITLLRLSVSMAFFVLAAIRKNPAYNYIGLGVHWLGDVADGFFARRFKQETILGAEIDIIADRVDTLLFYINLVHFRPAVALPAVIYVLDFAFLDFYLSYQFIKFDIISPNYFYTVDKTVYALNFSPVAKFCNSTVVTSLLIFLPKLRAAAAFLACILIGIKTYSIFILQKASAGGGTGKAVLREPGKAPAACDKPVS